MLGLVGPIAAFGLFYLGDRVLHIDRPQIQTMMYLLLSVAGHLTIFQTRTRGPWWSIRPAPILLLAIVGTQAVATVICVFGFLVTPLWWGWAAMVWGYALAWFLVTDPVKLLAYQILDPAKAGPKLEAKIEAKPEAKPDTQSAAEAEPQPEAKAEPEPEAKAEPKQKPEAKPEVQRAVDAKPDAAPKPEAKAASEAEAKPEAETKPEAKPDTQTAAEGKPEAEPEPEAKADVAALLNTTLGEILVAGLVKGTEDAGRLIAQGIIQTEARIAAAKAPEAEAAPEPAAKPMTPPTSVPKAARDPISSGQRTAHDGAQEKDQSKRVWSAALSHTLTRPVIAIVMGVSGCGKTTVAALLAAALGCQFQEVDSCIRPRTWRKCGGWGHP